jgi:hypothetical protein
MALPCFIFGTVHSQFKGFQNTKFASSDYRDAQAWLGSIGNGTLLSVPAG